MKIGMRVAGLIMLALMFTVAAFSQTQSTTGTIQGRVEDQQGAVIQGATVEARNTETNFSRQQQTDGDGRFVLLALPPGR